MLRTAKSFAFGLAVGAALTLIALDIWAGSLQNDITDLAQPRLFLPVMELKGPRNDKATIEREQKFLQPPWTPETTSGLHDSWRVRPLDGKPLALADLKGKVVFLNFWRTSCLPCIYEMPSIKRLRDSLKETSVTFLAVSSEDERRVRGLLKDVRIEVPVYLAEKEPPEDLPAYGVPTTFILDRSGNAVFRHVGAANWDSDNVRAFIRNFASEGTAGGQEHAGE